MVDVPAGKTTFMLHLPVLLREYFKGEKPSHKFLRIAATATLTTAEATDVWHAFKASVESTWMVVWFR